MGFYIEKGGLAKIVMILVFVVCLLLEDLSHVCTDGLAP